MSNSSGIKNSNKKSNSRDRDRNKPLGSESGGSSQCDTPPLIDKDASTSQGRFAGISMESVLCMAEQVEAELSADAATNLAEDVSYKLRQMINAIGLHSGMLKKSCVDCQDVNSVLALSDTSPIVGTSSSPYVLIGEEKVCCQVESLLNVTECALSPQSYFYSTLPTVSVEWITDEKSLNNSNNISVSLQNYYTKVARAILNLRRKPKEIAVDDLMKNTRIGPIFPNLFNLAVLVLNDDNLIALNVPAKKPLQANVLDMVDALCSNPCSLDTNIQQQFQRLFPVMVSNILGNGSLAEKMVAILTKITRTWPSFIAIGKTILFEYLGQGADSAERLSGAMIKCVMALGRSALVECLEQHLARLDRALRHRAPPDLRHTLLDVSSCLLRSEPTTYLEDYVTTDYTLYEILGDSILPRRTLFPHRKTTTKEEVSSENPCEDENMFGPSRMPARIPRFRLFAAAPPRPTPPRDRVFEPTKFSPHCCIKIKIANCRSIDNPRVRVYERTHSAFVTSHRGVVAVSGLLNRARYKLKTPVDTFPIYGAFIL